MFQPYRIVVAGVLIAMSSFVLAQPASPSAAALRLRSATPAAAQASLMRAFTLEAAQRLALHATSARRHRLARHVEAQREAATELMRIGARRDGHRQGARRDGARDRLARTGDLRPVARSPELRVRAVRRAEQRIGAVGLADRRAITSRCTGRSGRPLRRDAAAVLRRQPGPRAARLRPRRSRAGKRVLGEEEDRARALLASLSPQQRASASSTPDPMATSSRATPSGPPPEPKGIASGRCRRRSRRSCCRWSARSPST